MERDEMTDRERIVEILMASYMDPSYGHDAEYDEVARAQVRKALAALGAAGYTIYRYQDCASVRVEKFNEDWGIVGPRTVPSPPGLYLLVPVGGDS